MSPRAAIVSVFTNYFRFRGRARRSEYWWFVLIRGALAVALFLAVVALDRDATAPEEPLTVLEGAVLIAILILAFGTAIPELTVTVRRLHDIGNSGLWYLIGFIPVMGTLILFAVAMCPGTKGNNRFGPDPKAVQTKPSAGGPDQGVAWPGPMAPALAPAQNRSTWTR